MDKLYITILIVIIFILLLILAMLIYHYIIAPKYLKITNKYKKLEKFVIVKKKNNAILIPKEGEIISISEDFEIVYDTINEIQQRYTANIKFIQISITFKDKIYNSELTDKRFFKIINNNFKKQELRLFFNKINDKYHYDTITSIDVYIRIVAEDNLINKTIGSKSDYSSLENNK